MTDAQIQYVSDENGEATAVIVPISLWREIQSESGIVCLLKKERAFFELGNCFRKATDPDEVQRLGDELGRAIFGD